MEDDILKQALGFIRDHLAEKGALYANLNIGQEPVGSWREFPVLWRPREFYLNTFSAAGLTFDDLGSLADLGHRSGEAEHDNQRMIRGCLLEQSDRE
jgi:hypothetical protein